MACHALTELPSHSETQWPVQKLKVKDKSLYRKSVEDGGLAGSNTWIGPGTSLSDSVVAEPDGSTCSGARYK